MVKELILEKDSVGTEEGSHIILFNDHVNSFEWVIKSLVEVLDHEPEQAHQCAIIAHSKGKYAVKTGSRDELLPRANALGERGLTVELS
jgi:ATP-dependent Clp protease adaptor protein ClpS